MDLDAIARHPVPSYVAAVMLPSAVVAAPWFYAEASFAQVSGVYGVSYLLVLSLLFIGHLRRIQGLAENHRRMARHTGPYVLLLRSFGRTEGYAHTLVDRGPDGWASPPHEQSEIGAMEAALRARGLRLVALGGDFLLPAGHGLFWLTTRDACWETNFERLAVGAQAILICPETSQGIRHEIATLRARGLLARSVFLMAPTRRPRSFNFEAVAPAARADRWAALRASLATEGIELPPYDPAGCFFTLDETLRMAGRSPVPLDTTYGTGPTWTAAARRRDERMLEATGAAMLELLPAPAPAPARWADVYPHLVLDRPLHEGANHLRPPGANLWLGWLSFMGLVWGVFHNGLAVIDTFATPQWIVPGLLLALVAVGVGKVWHVVRRRTQPAPPPASTDVDATPTPDRARR